MRFLLDTNAVIAVLEGHEGFIRRLRWHKPSDFAISSIVYHELIFGACGSQRVEVNLRTVASLEFDILELSKHDAVTAGEIRARLYRNGTPIGPYDVLIAGQAVARSRVLITNNIKEFSRVEQLSVEDWQFGQ